MTGDARARIDARGAPRAFRPSAPPADADVLALVSGRGAPRACCPSARPSHLASWNGRSNVTAPSRAPRRRRRTRAGAGVLGSTLLLVALTVQADAQSRLGRLFSDPEQRIELDRLRSEIEVDVEVDAMAPREPVAGPAEADSRPGADGGSPALAATFNGLVVRGDGHRVAWFDGVETVPGAMTPTGVRIDAARTPGARLRVRLPDGRTSAVLAPGQSIDAQGGIRDAYQRGSPRLAAGAADARREHSGGIDEGADTAGAGPEHSGGIGEGADAGPPVASPGAGLPAALSANLVQEFLRATRVASALPGTGVSGVPSAAPGTGASGASSVGDGQPKRRRPAGGR